METVKDGNRVAFFREAAPYIHSHRGKTFVVAFAGEVVNSSQFQQILQDLAIVSSLGARLVLVHGTRPQIDKRLHHNNVPIHLHKGIRVTDMPALLAAQEAIGFTRIRIENLLTHILNQPSVSSDGLGIISGNFMTARPMGIHDGIDYGFTGLIRRINHALIRQQLEANNIVLLSPIGYSPTGEAYNLFYEHVAIAAAKALSADKLIFFSHQSLDLPPELTLDEAKTYQHALLPAAIEALEAGVERIHLLDATIDGALLVELYTRDGMGSTISAEQFECLRAATVEDISSILDVIRPLENGGTLVKRSREHLEMEIQNFHVITRDRQVIACAALYDTDNVEVGELACLAVHPDYRGGKRGDKLLGHITRLAQKQGKTKLLVLTTQTTDWFREREFTKGSIEELPDNKKSLYNYQRNSQILFKQIARCS
ncbi:amino-acid N-acetyltransferase [Oscillatoria sp. FACHB-1406]|uniref:amino-acid N-acetyltransferase n=1 Tax=Oscillatoria sp. FACHB-1406 TaxID=2692846 RepID=UPI001686A664|nr:amino-acid N-acetyltransferase [Oscillatoria sp. FACHB-1406]MBD2578930.1 amino-acid N-acetyltransferase [Oscillatoria sp. FACHB-1406]